MSNDNPSISAAKAREWLRRFGVDDACLECGEQVTQAELEDVLCQSEQVLHVDWRGYLGDALDSICKQLERIGVLLEIDDGEDEDSAILTVGGRTATVRYVPNEDSFDQVMREINRLIQPAGEYRRLRCSLDWDTYVYGLLRTDDWQQLDAGNPLTSDLFVRLER